MATELTPDQIAAAAASPSSVTVDGQTVTTRPAADVIKLDQYAIQKAGPKGAKRIRFGVAVFGSHTHNG